MPGRGGPSLAAEVPRLGQGDGAFNSPLNGALNGPLNSLLNGPLNERGNGPFNGVHKPP
jgi:hypothetical protein